jgi:O-antigen/teichoic acid export membrane protein
MSEEIQQQDNQQLQPEAPTSNKRIAKNALMLYIRMFISMIVGLYTSRVVLATLGVEDYGIYGVVGGVVAMMGFLNASMSGATSRFLTFELGRGDTKRLAETFSSALIVHIGIALIVFIFAETIGLWFLCNKLVIPEGRMEAAHWVYQCSILSAMLGITQAPYNASIIAHEKMGVYAYVEILNVTLKLLIVYLLVIGDFDKLILYAILHFAVVVVILLIYRIYCIRKFKETHFRWIWKKDILKPLLSFSGWNLYGNLGSMVQQQGTNFVINFFFGVVLNAAMSIGLTVANTVNHFGANVMVAFRPQIIKNYSQDNKEGMKKLTILAIKVIMFIYCLVAIPVFVEAENLLKLWLVEVPEHAVVFCRLFLISIFFETIRYVLIIDIHATGNVKWVSFFSGTLFILVPFVTYLLFGLGVSVNSAVITIIVCNVFLCMINVYLIKHYVQISVFAYYKTVLRVVLTSALALFLAAYIKEFIPPITINIITNSLIGVSLVSFAYFVLCFDKDQRKYAVNLIKNKLHFK